MGQSVTGIIMTCALKLERSAVLNCKMLLLGNGTRLLATIISQGAAVALSDKLKRTTLYSLQVILTLNGIVLLPTGYWERYAS